MLLVWRFAAAPHAEGESPRCHRVCLRFERGQSWDCQFLEEDLKTKSSRRLSLKYGKKLFQIDDGRDCTWLELTDKQYAKLRRNELMAVNVRSLRMELHWMSPALRDFGIAITSTRSISWLFCLRCPNRNSDDVSNGLGSGGITPLGKLGI